MKSWLRRIRGAIGMGLAWGLLRSRTQSLIPSIASHVLWDLVVLVWAPFVVRRGGKVGNCGVDHFDLVREKDSWKIMNLTFSSRLTGCPAQ